jgi:hypothetical protein
MKILRSAVLVKRRARLARAGRNGFVPIKVERSVIYGSADRPNFSSLASRLLPRFTLRAMSLQIACTVVLRVWGESSLVCEDVSGAGDVMP